MQMIRYKALILDFDGTLAATLDDVVACMSATFTRFGLQPPGREAVIPTMGLPLEEAFCVLSSGESQVNEGQWVKTYRDIYKHNCACYTRLFPGAAEVLATAQQKQVVIAVVSNKGTAAIRFSLEKLGVISLVNVILGADAVTHKKPDPRLYRDHISVRLKDVESKDVLVVGDTEMDLQFAAAAGLPSCWAKYGYGNPQRCTALLPTHVISSLYDLQALF